jgi:FlaA1/EpsC-like NDP-sugar epimerase
MIDPVVIATGRDYSLFSPDVAAKTEAIRSTLSGRRVLVVGGAGSIGSATLRAILPYDPAAVHVIDQNENGLAELVRDLRGSGLVEKRLDLKLMPLDYGAAVSRRFLDSAGRYDIVLHFAALKHVRSEKDVSSILQMLDTNVLKQQRLMTWLAESGAPSRYFAVSTDKAANPANFMGASKRLMERLIFTESCSPLTGTVRTSARFANVAFSAGSLLASFPERIRRRQPVVVPRETRRFFVSVEEAAQICLLACAAVPTAHMAIPRMQPDRDLRQLAPIAEGFLQAAGFRAIPYDDETLAREAVDREAARGNWPLLMTPRDTDGEKESEVFVGEGEAPVEIGMSALLGIPQSAADSAALGHVFSELQRMIDDSSIRVGKPDLAKLLRGVVSEFNPLEAGRKLDERM